MKDWLRALIAGHGAHKLYQLDHYIGLNSCAFPAWEEK